MTRKMLVIASEAAAGRRYQQMLRADGHDAYFAEDAGAALATAKAGGFRFRRLREEIRTAIARLPAYRHPPAQSLKAEAADRKMW